MFPMGIDITDPSAAGYIAEIFNDPAISRREKNNILTSLMMCVQNIVTGVALSYTPEHCEDSSKCSAPEQHYPWSLLMTLADALEEHDLENSFDDFRKKWHETYNREKMQEELKTLPEDFSVEDILNGGDVDAEA